MTTKITLVLSMSLNLVLGLVILQNGHMPVSLGDMRDAVADNRAAVQTESAAPAQLLPPPAAEPALTDAPPAAAAVEEQPRPAAIIVANDWAAYRQEMAEDRDVLVSNVFLSQKNAKRAMNAAVRKLQVSGKEVLFSCLMPATGGGMFYLIRLVPASVEIPRMTNMADIATKEYVKELQFLTARSEKDAWSGI